MRFCPDCGKPVDPDKKFCTNCGTPLNFRENTPSSPDLSPVSPPGKGISLVQNRNLILAIIAIMGIVVLGAIAIFIVPVFSGAGNNSSPTSLLHPAIPAQGTSTGSFVVIKETTSPSLPALGVWVHINYIGSWKATYGMPGALQTIENSGERYYEIPGAGGHVSLVVNKSDSSTTHVLEAGILKNGLLLVNGNTSAPFGSVFLSADAGPAPVNDFQIPATLSGITSMTPTMAMPSATTAAAGRTPAPVTGVPVCPSDRLACNGKCVDTKVDNTNCGVCGVTCPAGKYCLNGACMATCSAAQTSCPDGCFDLTSDPRHCGSCGNSCPAGLICFMSRCDSPATPMPVPQ